MTKCIVCNSQSNQVKNLNASDIKNHLFKLFENKNIFKIKIENYKIYKCCSCQLEFASPQLPGNDDFYEWLVQSESYYPNSRWEWQCVIELLQNERLKNKNIKTLLDVGCGSGAFLEKLNSYNEINGIGIDLTQSSVEECRKKGITAFNCDISSIKTYINDEIDVITAFHVLEHVDNPLDFLKTLKNLIKKEGYIIISTPYSPMSIEENWFDPLNYPPHHLTRWNLKSYYALANQLNMSIDFEYPSKVSIARRVFTALSVRIAPSFQIYKRRTRILKLINYILLNPKNVAKEIIKQLKRSQIDGIVAPDSILVKFIKINH